MASSSLVKINRRFSAANSFHNGILASLFYPEDGGDRFLRKVGRLSSDYTQRYSPVDNNYLNWFLIEGYLIKRPRMEPETIQSMSVTILTELPGSPF
jgi:hypothetical protein